MEGQSKNIPYKNISNKSPQNLLTLTQNCQLSYQSNMGLFGNKRIVIQDEEATAKLPAEGQRRGAHLYGEKTQVGRSVIN